MSAVLPGFCSLCHKVYHSFSESVRPLSFQRSLIIFVLYLRCQAGKRRGEAFRTGVVKKSPVNKGKIQYLQGFHESGDNGTRTHGLLNAIQALSRLDRLHTPLNRANRAFNTRDTPPKAAKPSAFFLKFIIAGARPHINTKFENKLDTAIPFSHGIISLFHSERGC